MDENFYSDRFIVHLPKLNKALYGDILEKNHTKKFIKPDNIDIVIPITIEQVENSYLIKQLKINDYNYYNIIDKPIVWEKADKIKYVYESLKLCKNDYCLIMDGNDTVIINDLTNLVDRFKFYNRKMVFNAEIYRHKKLFKPCLNGGVVFGEREILLKFYKTALGFLSKDEEKGKKVNTEQKYLLLARISMIDEVAIDHKEKLFKCFNYAYKGE